MTCDNCARLEGRLFEADPLGQRLVGFSMNEFDDEVPADSPFKKQVALTFSVSSTWIDEHQPVAIGSRWHLKKVDGKNNDYHD